MKHRTLWEKRRKRISTIIEIGSTGDYASRAYDMVYCIALLANLAASIMDTFQELRTDWGTLLMHMESITVFFFAVDCVLRIWTATCVHPGYSQPQAIRKYVFSFAGIVDILSFLPHYLPLFFPAGMAAFRMIRVVRIFRLFRINAYYDALNVISEVIARKRQQLISSVFIILVLMVASSLCMYSLEHEAQPEVFANAFSGIWWSVSTLLTVGYGDIYPITTLGKLFGIVISFLGVGMVAIPTGIISAGFVDQYSHIKKLSEYAQEAEIQFIKIRLTRSDRWTGQAIRDISLPTGILLAAVKRGQDVLLPHGDLILNAGDTLILGAKNYPDDTHIELKEATLKEHHPWNGLQIQDLDISRKTVVVAVYRKKKLLSPHAELVLLEGDKVILYTQSRMTDTNSISL